MLLLAATSHVSYIRLFLIFIVRKTFILAILKRFIYCLMMSNEYRHLFTVDMNTKEWLILSPDDVVVSEFASKAGRHGYEYRSGWFDFLNIRPDS